MISKDYKTFFYLSFAMAIIVIISNYLVQFPINYYGLQNLLTYGAFTYPITFLITDLSNRSYGKDAAKKVVYVGFICGVLITLFISTNFSDLISVRIAIGSGTAFLIAQIIDIHLFDRLRNYKNWIVAPLTSSLFGSTIDTFLFFFIAFYNTGISWVSLALGDFLVKVFIAMIMLIPFRILLSKMKNISDKKVSYKVK